MILHWHVCGNSTARWPRIFSLSCQTVGILRSLLAINSISCVSYVSFFNLRRALISYLSNYHPRSLVADRGIFLPYDSLKKKSASSSVLNRLWYVCGNLLTLCFGSSLFDVTKCFRNDGRMRTKNFINPCFTTICYSTVCSISRCYLNARDVQREHNQTRCCFAYRL